MDKANRTGIFLSGGGARGSFHIGFLKALEEYDIEYNYIFGCSAGAIVAGASTYLSASDIYERWKRLTLENVLKIDSKKIVDYDGARKTLMLYRECALSCLRRDPNFFIDINDIRKLLYELLDGEAMRESKIDFGISTTLLPFLQMQNIWKEDMVVNPLEYILASIYLPIFSRQRIIDGRQYMDLCKFRRFPFEVLKEKGCDNIFVVNLESENVKKITMPVRRYFNEEDVTVINYDNSPSILDFSPSQIEENYQRGYETTVRVLKRGKMTRNF